MGNGTGDGPGGQGSDTGGAQGPGRSAGGQSPGSAGGQSPGATGGQSPGAGSGPSPASEAHLPASQRTETANAGGSKGIKQGVGAGALGGLGALIAGASGGSVVGTHESLMSIATAMAQGAGIDLPPALMVTFLYKQSTGKTTKLEKAAQTWDEAAKQLTEAVQQLNRLVREIPGEAWTMDDRPLYESAVQDFSAQVDALSAYLDAVQISIMVVAWALFTYSVFAMGMAVYLDALAIIAAAALLASATGIGALGGGPAYAQCLALAGTGLTITAVATGILATAGTIAAATMGAGALMTANSQENNGATGAFDAFQKGVATGAAGAAANLAQAGVNSGLNFLNRSGKGMFPAAELDFDADRDIDKTWNVGGGAKLTTPGGMGEFEGGYHAKIRNGEVQGQEVEGKIKGTTPGGMASGSLGGKLEWDENEKLKNKSFNAGVESGPLGSKAEYEGNWDDQNKYSDKYNINTPGFNRTDGSIQKKADDQPPPWEQNL
ncbi:hypothetical protein ACGFNU_25315 [Spirillospora sp. NPDC048911]|uniref:hypothetical protein n=1 Tax=Spirillospora sp. NPDC048911 TaxID=3364527 RepID=UPI0037102C18